MKRPFYITVIILNLLAISCLAQYKIAATEISVSPKDSLTLSESLLEYSILTFDLKSLNTYVKSNASEARIQFPLTSKITWNMVLRENEIRSKNYQVIVNNQLSEKRIIDNTSICNTYSGYVNSDKNQYVRLFINSDKIMGLIVDKDKGSN